jgi:ATP-dependent DNA ligase
MTSKLPRVEPARCRGRFSDDLWTDNRWVAERKLDGGRYTLYLDYDDKAYFYSRRDFPRIEKAANVPHVTAYPGLWLPANSTEGDVAHLRLRGTILDGEVKLEGSKHLGDTTGVMNMTSENAVETQRLSGRLTYTLFDVVYLLGVDFRGFKYSHRRAQLKVIVDMLQNPYIKLIDAWDYSSLVEPFDKSEVFERVVAEGGEGVVLKHVDSTYGQEWTKRKKVSDVSVFISDFQRGQGKYADTLGAFILSVFHRGEPYEIGKASGMTDEVRDEVWAHRGRYMHKVVDVRAQELSKHMRLREPRFLRFRDDLSIQDCTLDEVVRVMTPGP